MLHNEGAQSRRFYGRPADRSLQAYKDFVRSMALALDPDANDNLSEDEWRQGWQRFWAAARDTCGLDQ